MPTLNLTHHPQRQESDCLAACALIALEHIDVRIRYGRLLRLLKVRPNAGASFLNLTQLEHHYPSLSVKVEREYNDPLAFLEDALHVGTPIINSVNTNDLSYWQGESTDHAVVVSGIDGQVVSVYDPWFKSAPLQVEKKQFESAWLRRTFLYATIAKST